MRAIRAHLPKIVILPAILASAAAVALAGSSVPAAADPIPANEVLSFMMSATGTNTTITFQHAASINAASGDFAALDCINCVAITPNPLEFDLSTSVIDLTAAAPAETATFVGNMPLSFTQLGFITEITQQGTFDLPGFSPTDAGIEVLFNSFTDTADIGLSTEATVNVAPAPLIGRGLPAILAVGGLLVLTELAIPAALRRRHRNRRNAPANSAVTGTGSRGHSGPLGG